MGTFQRALLSYINKHTFIQNVRRLSNLSITKHATGEEIYKSDVLGPSKEDLSDVGSYLSNTFNLAAYVNKSETLQKLLQLGIDLSKIEKNPHFVNALLKLNFERDIKPHLFFLKDFVLNEKLGTFLTKNPLIFKESLDNLEVRINYLIAKKFNHEDIQRIVSLNPFWLSFSTLRIDNRLGIFQNKFKLNGSEVRFLATKQPRLITYNLHHINTNTFAIKEEMGFKDVELKKLLLSKPKLWMMNQSNLMKRFNYIHNVMKIPHEKILSCPELLLYREFKIRQKHMFLEKLGRAQYDPKKENYVCLKTLAVSKDVDFCREIAKCPVDDFNMFLKTL